MSSQFNNNPSLNYFSNCLALSFYKFNKKFKEIFNYPILQLIKKEDNENLFNSIENTIFFLKNQNFVSLIGKFFKKIKIKK
jgi:hypothetical protein